MRVPGRGGRGGQSRPALPAPLRDGRRKSKGQRRHGQMEELKPECFRDRQCISEQEPGLDGPAACCCAACKLRVCFDIFK